MNFNYRVKVLGKSVDQLLALGLDVNTQGCNGGELWAIATSSSRLESIVDRYSLTIISNIEAIR